MNRKDTIIIAVLINAGLLALLFMMAINTEDEVINNPTVLSSALNENQNSALQHSSGVSQPQLSIPSKVVIPSSTVLADASSADEMDNFLKDMSSNHLSQSSYVDDEGLVDLDSDLVHAIPPEKNEDATSDTRIVEITVKRGDALEKIARSNGTTIEMIKKINNLSGSKLNIGQVLRIPVPVTKTSRPAPTVKANSTVATSSTTPAKINEAKANDSSEVIYYTIKSGDNPWKIAKEHKVKYDDILKWNGMDEEKARNLKVGDKIRVK